MSIKSRFKKLIPDKVTHKLQRLDKRYVFITAFMFIGLGTLLNTRAASPTAHFEAESAVNASCATSGSDGNASGGQYLKFSSSGCSAGGDLALPRIPWEGGPNYWKTSNGPQFAKADAAGWDDPSFFPISVFLGQMQSANYYKSLGINTYQAIEHNVNIWPLSSVTDTGMFVLAGQAEWTQAEVGNNPNVVGWFISDECEMGYSDCITNWDGSQDEYTALAVQQSYINKVKAYNDGRFAYANFGNGVVRTFWAPNTMDEHIALMDASSFDKYTYTSPGVRGLFDSQDTGHNSPDWPDGEPVDRAYSYGWMVDQLRRFQNGPISEASPGIFSNQQSTQYKYPPMTKPAWVFVETGMPYLFGDGPGGTEPGATTITPGQMEGAVWSGIIHEARGIGYFMHNNSPDCYSGTACYAALMAKLTAINGKIKSLAPVINTQSYQYNFNNGTDTMLKTYNGFAYIFAGIGLGQSPGNKTFTLPTGVNGTSVEVVGEGRTLTVNGSRQFTDNFAAEYTHHVYKIAL